MQEGARSFAPLLIVITLAFVVPLLLSRFKHLHLPIVVGEILAGVLIGRSGFGWVQADDPMLALLAEFGFVFLMFQAGLEIDFSSLDMGAQVGATWLSQASGPIGLSLLSFLGTLGLAVVAGVAMEQAGMIQNPWMMALILSTTSLGIVMPVLKERGMIRSALGQTVLLSALIADFVTMILITVVVAIYSRGLSLEILLIGLLFVFFFLFYRLGLISLNRFEALRRTFEELSQTTARIKIRGAFTLMLLFVVLSEALGAEIILGAFLAGAMISLLSTRQDVEAMHQMEAVGFGFFIPIFFVMVGVNFNLRALFNSADAIWLLLFLLAVAFTVKLLPTLIFRLRFSWRETFSAGFLLSSRLSLIIAASAIGLELGIISESINTEIILVAVLTVTLAPLLFNRFAPAAESARARSIAVFGAGELGLLVAQHLSGHHERVLLMDDDLDRVERARNHVQSEIDVVHGCVDGDATLAPYLEQIDTVVVTYSDTEQNFRICRLLRTHYRIQHVVTSVPDARRREQFQQLGITVFTPSLDLAALLGLLARNPAVYDLLTQISDDKEVAEVAVENSELDGVVLRRLNLPGDVLILALRRGGEFIVPRGNTRLEVDDHVTLAGSIDHLNAARRRFGRVGVLGR